VPGATPVSHLIEVLAEKDGVHPLDSGMINFKT
jgi:hypothetical protein